MLQEMIAQAEVETGASGLRKATYAFDGVGMVTTIGELATEAVALAGGYREHGLRGVSLSAPLEF
jgi:hypothetical protein